MGNRIFLALVLFFSFTLAHAAEDITSILNSHFAAFKDKEYFSGIALSIYVPKQDIKNYYIGHVSHDQDSKKIDPDTLFNIGSITKSFTAAIVLQLEKEKKLHLDDTLQKWLPEYSKWPTLTIKSLLNMTSGLPNYSDAPLMNAEEFSHPQRQWTDIELIEFVYPTASFNPPLKKGYFYSNTGYLLTSMIINKATEKTFKSEIEKRLIKPAQLSHTFYPVPVADKQMYMHLAHGYNFNPYANPELVGRDMQMNNLSWAGAAGAVISNASDVIKWVKALFVENKILDQAQKNQLMQLISTDTGNPIKKTSSNDPRAFGLGISQGFDKMIGEFWFYEGETEGFRALYMYVPSTGIIIASIFNSAVDSENDHASELMKKVYQYTRTMV